MTGEHQSRDDNCFLWCGGVKQGGVGYCYTCHFHFMRTEGILHYYYDVWWNLTAGNLLKSEDLRLWFFILCSVFSGIRKGMCVSERLRWEMPGCPDRGQLMNSSMIPSAFCLQCIIFCLQVLSTDECYPGGTQCHHRYALQPHVWEDRGGESGERQQGKVQYSGMCGYGGGRAGVHALFHQRWVT